MPRMLVMATKLSSMTVLGIMVFVLLNFYFITMVLDSSHQEKKNNDYSTEHSMVANIVFCC